MGTTIFTYSINFVNSSNYFFNLDYSRAEVAADARHRHMKLWLSTANVS